MTDWPYIIEQNYSLVWRTVQRLLRHEVDTADCVQRTFVAAFEFSQTTEVKSWPALLSRLATSRALDQLRKRIREQSCFQNSTADFDIEQQSDRRTETPDDIVATAELAEHLRIALTEIDSRQAQVFYLITFESQSYEEIGEQLGIKVSHARVLLNRAKDALREKLRVYGERPETATKRLG